MSKGLVKNFKLALKHLEHWNAAVSGAMLTREESNLPTSIQWQEVEKMAEHSS